MDRLTLNQGKTTAETTVTFSIKRTIESMDRLAIIEGEKIVQITVRSSIK